MPESPHAGAADSTAANAPDPEQAADSERAAARRRFADLLERDEPLSEAVMQAALEDPLYVTHLFASRDLPQFLDLLVTHAEERSGRVDGGPTNGAPAMGSAELLRKFSRAMVQWGQAGFKPAPEDVVERRRAACQACPELKQPGGSILRRVAAAAGLGDQTCGLCGCLVSAKTRIDIERCPGEDPRHKGYSRWGDPFTG